jgi:lipoyl(octanoyl) transferase
VTAGERPCDRAAGAEDAGMDLEVACCGQVPYDTALAWQEALQARRLAGGNDALLLLEHTPVYTLGRGADAGFLGAAAAGDVPVVRVGRGGQVTYHGPGQLVGYPILDLRAHRADVRWYVRALEQVLIDALAELGVRAVRRDGFPGVWVGGARKIGSIGVGIRRWVTWHGFALNVGPDLRGFDRITPCGISGVTMTSVAREGGTSDVDRVAQVVLARFVAQFGYRARVPLAVPAEIDARGDRL